MTSGRTRLKKIRVGTTIAEAPLALWIIILGMAFPLLILVMTSVKYGLFWNAARDACKQACQAQTFEQPPPNGGLSAVDTANQVATAAAASFSGITIVPPVQVYIIRTDLTSGVDQKMPVPNQRLNGTDAPPDPDKYYYAIQVELDGTIDPFLNHPGLTGIPIPGLTTSFPVRVTSQQPFENIQGLDD